LRSLVVRQRTDKNGRSHTSKYASSPQRLAYDLVGKEQERERVLELFRRGRITPTECDRDLDKVAAEAREIREMLDALRARAEMAAASEAHLSDVGAALTRMQGRLEEIERTNDQAAMRELIELLAPGIAIQTELLGLATVRERKRPILRPTLAFRSNVAVVPITRCSGSTRTSRIAGSRSGRSWLAATATPRSWPATT
jgi:hypothetical protein